MDELKNLIVSKIREEGLSNKFDQNDLKEIEQSIKSFYKSRTSNNNGEAPIEEVEYRDNKFPYKLDDQQPPQDQGSTTPTTPTPLTGETIQQTPQNIEHPIDTPYEPVVSNSVENIPIIPRPLQEKECPKLVVSDYNELSHGGESLASKTFRTLDDLDVRKSAGELWENDACVESEVYIMKFEKVGKLKYNFTNNTAVFEEQRFDIEPDKGDVENIANQQDNPYEAKHDNLENIVKTSVDMERVIGNVVKDILRNSLMNQNGLDS